MVTVFVMVVLMHYYTDTLDNCMNLSFATPDPFVLTNTICLNQSDKYPYGIQ